MYDIIITEREVKKMEEIINIAYESIELLKEIRELLTQEQNDELDNLRNRYNNYLDVIGW